MLLKTFYLDKRYNCYIGNLFYMENEVKKIYPEIENLAALMDDKFELFGFRFGLNLLIDLIPEVGDFITTAIALYIFRLSYKYEVSNWVRFRMLLNITVYFIVGLIPWAGDAFGVWFKPNRRNLKLLQNKL